MRLRGRVALVTGGAHRIGKVIALLLARRGVSVAVTYRTSKGAARATARQCRAHGVRAMAVRVNQADVAEIRAAVRAVEDAWRRIDLLVNNASVFYPTPIRSVTQEQWDDFLNVNLRGPFFFAQAVAEGMLRRHFGRIINIADASAFRPWSGYVPYGISKAGVVAMTYGLAKALAPHVQVNAIAPGPIVPPAGLTRAEYRRAASATRRPKAPGSLTSRRFNPSSRRPAEAKCVWLSMKPGRTSRPPRSSTRVRPRRISRRTSALPPTLTMRLPSTATASASGLSFSTVQTLAFTSARSAARRRQLHSSHSSTTRSNMLVFIED